jgi:3-deoxy-D-manno-octulosonate 8-phosphate phosphatase (KDO 8-P phosphatase)
MKEEISNLKQVRLFVYDFDGVMTDNTFILDEKGNEQVSLNRSDGLAVAEIKKRGYKQIILSTENSEIITLRARKLAINCLIGIDNKLLALKEYLNSEMLEFAEIAYVGNDNNDLEAMSHAKVRICPNDAQNSIKEISNIILERNGGQGVIREIFSLLTIE